MATLPPSLIASLKEVVAFDAAAFEAVHATPQPATSIRLNPAKPVQALSLLEQDTQAIPWCSNGRYLSARPSFTMDPLFHAGGYYVQEASSMFLWHLLEQLIGSNTHLNVLDLCAAPGGKSTLLASYFTKGLLVSNEVIKSRANILEENLVKWGSENVVITNNDPSHFKSLSGFFDVVVVDAPCSGSGLFRKDPDAIKEWSLDNVALCAQRQQRILADVLPCLKTGGLLIYATCSYSTAENEAICDWLSTQQLHSKQVTVPTEWGIVATQSEQFGAYGYRFFPYLTKGEGFFIAAFEKSSHNEPVRWKEQKIPLANKQEQDAVEQLFSASNQWQLFKQQESIKLFPKAYFTHLQILAKHLYIKKAGIEIGGIKGKDLIPHHEWAMSTLPKTSFTHVEVDLPTAIAYLQKKAFTLTAPVGWTLLTYCSLPLGWVKVLPNRINNYYPNEWRILKS